MQGIIHFPEEQRGCYVLLSVCLRPTKRIGEEEWMARVKAKRRSALQHPQQQPGSGYARMR